MGRKGCCPQSPKSQTKALNMPRHTNMINMNETKLRVRTVSMGERGQIVIPEDMRKDLELQGKETLVLIEKDGEIVIRKEFKVVTSLLAEDELWAKASMESLRDAWGKEDEIWDAIAKKDLKGSK